MADLVQTAANVAIGAATTTTKLVPAGEAITQGNSVYLKSDDKWWKADSNAAESAGSAGVGVAMTKAGAAADYFIVALKGPVNVGATLTPGMAYFVSNTAGGIIPAADLSSTEYSTYLGVATTAALLNLQPHASGGLTA